MDRQRSSLFAHQTSYRDRIAYVKTPYAMTVHFVFPKSHPRLDDSKEATGFSMLRIDLIGEVDSYS